MKQSCVSAFSRVARSLLRPLAVAAVGLVLGAVTLHAQATGKIEGRVRDQNGAPIANAQVFIVGTAFNATTNPQGYYFINNVPAGAVTLRAAFVGYRPTEVAGLRVLAGQTITQDIALEQTAVEVQEITVVAAEQPLVPRDEVATKQRISGEYTDKLPVDQISNVLALQPGVVASPGTGSLSIRGGRTDEAVTYIDGVPVTPGFRGTQQVGSNGTSVNIGTNALEEASITTGASSAEFGNAQSGVISLVTRGGGSQFSGNFGYETDEVFGKGSSIGLNRLQAGFGGPLSQNLTFFLSGTLQGNKSQTPGIDAIDAPLFVEAGTEGTIAVPSRIGDPAADTTYVPISQFAVYRGDCDDVSSSNAGIADNYGVDCQGIRVPNSANTQYTLSGRLNYSFGQGSRLAFSYNGSQNQGRNSTITNAFNPQAATGFRLWSNVFTLNWTQNLSKSAERALALESYVSYQQDRTIASPLTLESELDTRDPFGGFLITPIDFLFDFDNFPINDELINNIRLNQGRRSPYDLDRTNDYREFTVYGRVNPYAVSGNDPAIGADFNEGGGPAGRISLYKENRWVFKSNLDWQVDRYNRVKLGGEYTKYDISQYSHTLVSQAFFDAYIEKPTRWSAFIEDRLDLGDVVVQGGVRYDWYKTGASRPFVDATGTFFPRISSMPGFDPENPTALFKEDESHSYLSPHIQVAFPVTDRTNFRLSYAHQVQAPDFAAALQGINTDLSATNTNNVYGADLDFGKTIAFEFGIRHSFSEDMVLDLAAYNKDNLANAAGRLVNLFDPLRGTNADIRMITNADFGNTRGIDVRLDRRIGNLFNGTIAYTYQQAKSTGSDPLEYINFGSRILNSLGGGNQPPPQGILPTRNSRPHTLAGALSLTFPADWNEGSTLGSIFQNVGVFTTFRYASGTAFTRCEEGTSSEEIVSGGVCNGNQIFGTQNGARLPSFKTLDMRFTKGFALGGLDLTAYLDARNILNFENVLQVFATTNDITSAEDRDRFRSFEIQSLESEVGANEEVYGDDLFDEDTGAIDLTFGGAADPVSQCVDWSNGQRPAAPNCVYLIRAEERFGNGDGTYTRAEQLNAIDSYYRVLRGKQVFTGSPRQLRAGMEVNF